MLLTVKFDGWQYASEYLGTSTLSLDSPQKEEMHFSTGPAAFSILCDPANPESRISLDLASWPRLMRTMLRSFPCDEAEVSCHRQKGQDECGCFSPLEPWMTHFKARTTESRMSQQTGQHWLFKTRERVQVLFEGNMDSHFEERELSGGNSCSGRQSGCFARRTCRSSRGLQLGCRAPNWKRRTENPR